jgi:oligopeptide/dipeptide ABC transporter ATP-binding protein
MSMLANIAVAANDPQKGEILLSVKDLTITLDDRPKLMPIVQGLTFNVHEGECVGIVGESGSGKSLSSLALLNLLPKGVHISTGTVLAVEQDVTSADRRTLRELRGSLVSMVFQDPGAALNPSRTVGKLLSDVLKAHSNLTRHEIRLRTIEVLNDVGFPDPVSRLKSFPFQLSGGLRQRVAIAMALVNRPRILVADEPTTSLDVSVQKGILQLIRHRTMQDRIGCVFVSHDLGVIAEVADRVIIMYSGQVVEEGPVKSVLSNPKHPYTRGLIASAPSMTSTLANPLRPIPGTLPSVGCVPVGCAFQDRCPDRSAGLCSPDKPTWSQDEANVSHRWLCRSDEITPPELGGGFSS